jgi:hypothetical protein
VIEEARVFAGQHGAHEVGRDAVIRHPRLHPLRLKAGGTGFGHSLSHQRRRFGIVRAIPQDAGQHVAVIEQRDGDE